MTAETEMPRAPLAVERQSHENRPGVGGGCTPGDSNASERRPARFCDLAGTPADRTVMNEEIRPVVAANSELGKARLKTLREFLEVHAVLSMERLDKRLAEKGIQP